MNRKWKELYNGGSDVWLWVAQDSLVCVFVEIIDLPAHYGRDATAQWCASVDSVDLGTTSLETLAGALRSCGWEDMADLSAPRRLIALAECLHSYGARSPLWSADAGEVAFDGYGNLIDPDGEMFDPDEDGPEFQNLKAQAFAEAETLLDKSYRDEQLDTRIVNRLGQTAREYADPDGFWDALRRIAANPEATDDQRVILATYRACDKTLDGTQIPDL